MPPNVCGEGSVELQAYLLTGKVYAEILRYTREQPPWLLVLGRLGIHGGEDMDLGGNTESICRLARCNLLVVDLKSRVRNDNRGYQPGNTSLSSTGPTTPSRRG